eukprot:gene9166-biopygen7956
MNACPYRSPSHHDVICQAPDKEKEECEAAPLASSQHGARCATSDADKDAARAAQTEAAQPQLHR